jgi:hypothetical protein
MNSIGKVASLVARIALVLVVLASALLLLAKSRPGSTTISAQAQGHNRVVTRKPWRVEPLKIVSAKTKKEKIDIGKPFDGEDDWLDGFTVTVANNSQKTVTAVVVDMVFRRDRGESKPPLAWSLNFGPDPLSPKYLQRDPNRTIKVGETADLELDSENFKWLTRFLKQNDFPVSVNRVELIIAAVGFEDGSVLYRGTLFLQDPKNPNDPTKKIPASPPQHTRGTTTALDPISRRLPQFRRSFAHFHGAQDDDCFTLLPPRWRQCTTYNGTN